MQGFQLWIHCDQEQHHCASVELRRVFCTPRPTPRCERLSRRRADTAPILFASLSCPCMVAMGGHPIQQCARCAERDCLSVLLSDVAQTIGFGMSTACVAVHHPDMNSHPRGDVGGLLSRLRLRGHHATTPLLAWTRKAFVQDLQNTVHIFRLSEATIDGMSVMDSRWECNDRVTVTRQNSKTMRDVEK